MKIGSDSTQMPLGVYRQHSEQISKANEQEGHKGANSIAPKGDSVQLSGDAKMMAEARGVASETSDVRTEKVAALREQVQNGTYKVDNNRIAEGILKEDVEFFGV